MLEVRNIAEIATYFVGVGIRLEGKRFSALHKRGGVSVDPELVKEQSTN